MAKTTMRVVINKIALKRAVSTATNIDAALGSAVEKIVNNANILSSSFRTGIYHDHASGEVRGDTQPEFVGDVIRGKKGYVGLVRPANYAAMKDNHENNTLLKSF